MISLLFPGQYPWIAALGYRFPNTSIYGVQFHCAGSLITLTHVLTTAHCISDYLYVIRGMRILDHGYPDGYFLSIRRLLVRLGEFDLSSSHDGATPIDILIERKIAHENYANNIISNDIGLLKLRSSAPVNGKRTFLLDNIRMHSAISLFVCSPKI